MVLTQFLKKYWKIEFEDWIKKSMYIFLIVITFIFYILLKMNKKIFLIFFNV
jgi:hypothetical protein